MIFVTGASGNVGREVVRGLQSRGTAFRIGDRSPAAITTSGAETVAFDFLDATTYRSAVTGCNAVFLLRPPAISNTRKTLNKFIDVTRAHGVRQIVFISVAGAATNPIVPHHAVEVHLRGGPPGWTILRPGFFMQNLGSAYRADIRDDDRIYVPAGKGGVAFVDTRDLASVAVEALVDPEAHAGQAYTLTGSETLSFSDVAALLSAELGRTINYHPASIFGYVAHVLKSGLPLAQALVQTVLHVGLRLGQAEEIDPTLLQLLGHPPMTMAAYVRRNRDMWRARSNT